MRRGLRYIRWRAVIGLFIAVILCVVTGCGQELTGNTKGTAGRTEDGQGELQPDLRVHFINVGQGDSILIESQGHYMLIDAGENDKGELVRKYLEEQRVDTLDYVIGTHPHSDHIGGLDTVIDFYPTDKVILPAIEHTTKTFEDLLTAIEGRGLRITRPVVGDTYELGGAKFTLIAPNLDYGNDLNNWSIGVKLDYGNNSFIFTGDAEAEAERNICENGIDLSAEVLKLGHHGSSTSTTEELLKAVHPEYAVIMCGKDNSYGHPHQETMDLLNQYQIKVYRTDQQGSIVADSDGQQITWSLSPSVGNDNTFVEVKDAGEYVLNSNTMKFHNPDCSSVDKMKEEHKVFYSGTIEELKEQGYKPCGICDP